MMPMSLVISIAMALLTRGKIMDYKIGDKVMAWYKGEYRPGIVDADATIDCVEGNKVFVRLGWSGRRLCRYQMTGGVLDVKPLKDPGVELKVGDWVELKSSAPHTKNGCSISNSKLLSHVKGLRGRVACIGQPSILVYFDGHPEWVYTHELIKLIDLNTLTLT
jgi:hypothetical protein